MAAYPSLQGEIEKLFNILEYKEYEKINSSQPRPRRHIGGVGV
jgi:transcriptional regulator with AAA-type ATPase domain